MIDEITTETIDNNIKLNAFALVNDKNFMLIRAKEQDESNSKSYVRCLLLMVGNELITTNYADTRLLLSEIKLFEKGNKQNKYTTIERKDGDINLKLKLMNSHIYISKAEAMAITDIYNESKVGISMSRMLEYELKFTPETLTRELNRAKLLENKAF